MCPDCGRTVIVPVPEGLDVEKAREEGRRAAEEGPPPSKTRSFADALGTWADQTFVQRRLFTAVVLVVVIVVIPVLIWSVLTIVRTVQRGQDLHYRRGVDDQLDPKKYSTYEIRERARQKRVYEERLKTAKLLDEAKSLREKGELEQARDVLTQLVEKYPNSAQAPEARKILEELQGAPK